MCFVVYSSTVNFSYIVHLCLFAIVDFFTWATINRHLYWNCLISCKWYRVLKYPHPINDDVGNLLFLWTSFLCFFSDVISSIISHIYVSNFRCISDVSIIRTSAFPVTCWSCDGKAQRAHAKGFFTNDTECGGAVATSAINSKVSCCRIPEFISCLKEPVGLWRKTHPNFQNEIKNKLQQIHSNLRSSHTLQNKIQSWKKFETG